MDWLVLLTPLLLAPVALLPLFLGCGLATDSTTGVTPPDTETFLKYGPGLHQLATRIDIEIGRKPILGETTFHYRSVTEIKAAGGQVSVHLEPADTAGGLGCKCDIVTNTGNKTLSVLAGVIDGKYPTFLLKSEPTKDGGSTLHLDITFS